MRPIEILLVEDNPADVELTSEHLAEGDVDANLHVARDGIEALQFFRREGQFASAKTPDLVLLDLNLPRKGGLAVLSEAKRDTALQRIPIVVVSSSESPDDIDRCYALGANAYVAKPTDLRGFEAMIRAIDEFWVGVVCLPSH